MAGHTSFQGYIRYHTAMLALAYLIIPRVCSLTWPTAQKKVGDSKPELGPANHFARKKCSRKEDTGTRPTLLLGARCMFCRQSSVSHRMRDPTCHRHQAKVSSLFPNLLPYIHFYCVKLQTCQKPRIRACHAHTTFLFTTIEELAVG